MTSTTNTSDGRKFMSFLLLDFYLFYDALPLMYPPGTVRFADRAKLWLQCGDGVAKLDATGGERHLSRVRVCDVG